MLNLDRYPGVKATEPYHGIDHFPLRSFDQNTERMNSYVIWHIFSSVLLSFFLLPPFVQYIIEVVKEKKPRELLTSVGVCHRTGASVVYMVTCSTTDQNHLSSNLRVGIYGGCFIFDFASLPLEVTRPV